MTFNKNVYIHFYWRLKIRQDSMSNIISSTSFPLTSLIVSCLSLYWDLSVNSSTGGIPSYDVKTLRNAVILIYYYCNISIPGTTGNRCYTRTRSGHSHVKRGTYDRSPNQKITPFTDISWGKKDPFYSKKRWLEPPEINPFPVKKTLFLKTDDIL